MTVVKRKIDIVVFLLLFFYGSKRESWPEGRPTLRSAN